MDAFTTKPDAVSDGASTWVDSSLYVYQLYTSSASQSAVTADPEFTGGYTESDSFSGDTYGSSSHTVNRNGISSSDGQTGTAYASHHSNQSPPDPPDTDYTGEYQTNVVFHDAVTEDGSTTNIAGDTAAEYHRRFGRTELDIDPVAYPPTNFTNERTYNGFVTTITSSSDTIGLESDTTQATRVGGWQFPVATTVSEATTISGVPTSTWRIAGTNKTYATSQTTTAETDSPITAKDEFSSNKTNTSELTNHLFSPLEDTVILMQANRNLFDYNLGNQLWTCSATSLPISASSVGRFTDFYGSNSSSRFTISDYDKYTTASIQMTFVTFSQDTATTTTWAVTSVTPGTGDEPDTAHTGEVPTTVYFYSKNGAAWRSYDEYLVGTDHSRSLAASNTSTTTVSFSLGNISESGDGVFYYSYQETGYDDDNNWTQQTLTEFVNQTTSSLTYLALHESNTTTQGAQSVTSRTHEMLFSKYLTAPDGLSFVGYLKTTSTEVGLRDVTVTIPAWDYNGEIANWATSSTATSSGYAFAERSRVSNYADATHYTSARVLPVLNFENTITGGAGLDQVWYRAPARGYGGPVGSFMPSSMSIYQSVIVGIAAGNAFVDQTLELYHLATALAYEHVTVYPDASVELPSGAARASFVSRVSSAGQTASIAVTWTSTTMSDGLEVVTSRFATYTVRGVSVISGNYYRADDLTFNTDDVRGGALYPLSGGYGLGDNALNATHTVRLYGGFAEWTVYNSSTSIGSSSISNTAGSVSFTVPHSQAIVFNVEPLITMSWGVAGNNHFLSSVQYFPT